MPKTDQNHNIKKEYVIEFDKGGFIIRVNKNFADLLGCSKEKMTGIHHSEIFQGVKKDSNNYQKFWNELKNGIIKNEINVLNTENVNITLTATYVPISTKKEVGKVICFATKYKQNNKKL
ncbi:MAG: PAS domain S-box protein [Bacteroidia bacterium]|nr:PAS domain S-box protein [Bacteroidia bacterium]